MSQEHSEIVIELDGEQRGIPPLPSRKMFALFARVIEVLKANPDIPQRYAEATEDYQERNKEWLTLKQWEAFSDEQRQELEEKLGLTRSKFLVEVDEKKLEAMQAYAEQEEVELEIIEQREDGTYLVAQPLPLLPQVPLEAPIVDLLTVMWATIVDELYRIAAIAVLPNELYMKGEKSGTLEQLIDEEVAKLEMAPMSELRKVIFAVVPQVITEMMQYYGGGRALGNVLMTAAGMSAQAEGQTTSPAKTSSPEPSSSAPSAPAQG